MSESAQEETETKDFGPPLIDTVKTSPKPSAKRKGKKKSKKKKSKTKVYYFTDDRNCFDDVMDFGYDVFVGWWRD